MTKAGVEEEAQTEEEEMRIVNVLLESELKKKMILASMESTMPFTLILTLQDTYFQFLHYGAL